MDDYDRKILAALQRDATLALDKLGEKVGLSRNACWRRVKTLEADGVIDAKVTLLNAEKVGLGLTVFVLIRASRHDSSWLEEFRRATREMPEILGVYRMSGELDYLLKAQVSDVSGYDALYQRLVEKVSLAEVSASFVMEEIKNTTALPL